MTFPVVAKRFYWGQGVGFWLGHKTFMWQRADGSGELDLIRKIEFIRDRIKKSAKALIVDQIVRDYVDNSDLPLPDRVFTFKNGTVRFQYLDDGHIKNVDYIGRGEKVIVNP